MLSGYDRKIIAKTLKMTERRVKQLTEEGVLTEVSKGYYGLIESVHAYIEYIQNKNPTSDYNKERAGLTKTKREKEEAELAIMRGELCKTSDVDYIVSAMIIAFRAKMLTIPNKIAPEIKNIDSEVETISLIKKYIIEALEELSEFDANKLNVDESEEVDES